MLGASALALHRVEPRLVERHGRIIDRYRGADLPCQLGRSAARGEPVIDPRPLAETIEQPGIA